jgi:glutaryl-CoA dehydrogenase
MERELNQEQREIQSVTRKNVAGRIKPNIASWYESANLPINEFARELGDVDLVGMHFGRVQGVKTFS